MLRPERFRPLPPPFRNRLPFPARLRQEDRRLAFRSRLPRRPDAERAPHRAAAGGRAHPRFEPPPDASLSASRLPSLPCLPPGAGATPFPPSHEPSPPPWRLSPDAGSSLKEKRRTNARLMISPARLRPGSVPRYASASSACGALTESSRYRSSSSRGR